MRKTETIVELITIGREILDGRVTDTNSVAMAEALRSVGLTPRFGQRVDDELARINEALGIAARRSQLILVTGGLGPTSDDLTAEAFARFIGEEVRLDPEALAEIEAVFARFNRPMLEVQKKQAMLPPSCFILPNTEGTAPGFGLVRDGKHWFFMPGVPREMITMLKTRVLPQIKPLGLSHYRSKTWATQFTSEGKLQQTLTPVEKRLPPGFEVTYRTRFPENHIGLYGDCPSPGLARDFEGLADEITQLLGADVFSTTQGLEPLPNLEDVVLELLKKQGLFLATVESCTGGLVANRITNVAGSSSAFWGSHLVYDNAAKELLGVPAELIAKHGAVSPEVAAQLAALGLESMEKSSPQRFGGRGICIATTGIAGPGGGTAAKPVGLCYLGLARSGRPAEAAEIRGRVLLDRLSMKLFFAQKALELARQSLLSAGS